MNRTFVRVAPGLLLLAFAACGGGGGGGGGGDSGAGGSLSTDPVFAGDLADVQRAINDAAAGGTVQIGPGSYQGRLVVKKSITIVGSGNATILRGVQVPDDAVIEIVDTADVTVRDLTVSGPHEGIRIRRSARIHVEGVVAAGNAHEGIDVRQSNAVTIVQCDCTQNFSGGVRVRESSFDVLVEDCLVDGNLDQGIEVRDSTEVTVRTNVVTGNVGDGVRLRDSSVIELVDNVIEGNAEYGVRSIATPLDAGLVRNQNQISGNGEGDVRIEN